MAEGLDVLGAGELVEIIAGGGLCLTGDKREEAIDNLGGKKCCCCNLKHFLGFVCLCYVIFNISEVVMEGIAFYSCSTAEGVEYGLGLYLWLGAFIAIAVFVLPVEIWLLPYFISKKPSFWNRCVGRDTDPYCLCSTSTSPYIIKSVCNMRFSIHLFVVCEDVLRMVLSSGKFIFVASGIEANVEAFKGTSNIIALTILLVVEGIAFFIRWAQMYSKLPCFVRRCSFAIFWRTIVFDFVSFCVSLIAFAITALSFRYVSGLFAPKYDPRYSSVNQTSLSHEVNASGMVTPTATTLLNNVTDVTTPYDRPFIDDPSNAILTSINGMFGGVLIFTCIIYYKCSRK